MQTIELAKVSSGHVTGLDNYQPFLDELELKAKKANLSNKIDTINCSMFKMDFEPEHFDVIWAEGSIYIMGFEPALRLCQRFLKQDGYMAVTELSWFKDDPPQEVLEFWETEYPEMKTIDENLKIINTCGYSRIAHFVLPGNAWWDEFYDPLEKRAQMLKKKYMGVTKKLDVVNETIKEIDLYRKYPEWYGYVFYIMQKKRSVKNNDRSIHLKRALCFI